MVSEISRAYVSCVLGVQQVNASFIYFQSNYVKTHLLFQGYFVNLSPMSKIVDGRMEMTNVKLISFYELHLYSTISRYLKWIDSWTLNESYRRPSTAKISAHCNWDYLRNKFCKMGVVPNSKPKP